MEASGDDIDSTAGGRVGWEEGMGRGDGKRGWEEWDGKSGMGRVGWGEGIGRGDVTDTEA